MWCDEDLQAAAAAIVIILQKPKKKRVRKCWTRPSLLDRKSHGVIHVLNSLKKDDIISECIDNGYVKKFCRMSSTDLERLLCKISPLIQKEDTNYRAAISSLERLLLTLRFLATGDSYASLMYLFRISKQAISLIVPEFCDAIISVLQDQIKISASLLTFKVNKSNYFIHKT